MFFISKLKACFRQGENRKRAKVLKTIIEAIAENYTEDNYHTRLYWLVEEILINDPEFRDHLDEVSLRYIKKGLVAVVDRVVSQTIKT